MKPTKIIACDVCNSLFRPGNLPDGTPRGVGFQDKNGTIVNLCRTCVEKMRDDKEHQERVLKIFEEKGWRK